VNNKPNEDGLKNLFSMLPSMASGGVEEAAAARTKLCVICGETHRRVLAVDGENKDVATCRRCQDNLDEGYFALVSPDNRFAFMKTGVMSDKAGQVMQVETHTMDLVEKRMGRDAG
jgi:hypothetical protein